METVKKALFGNSDNVQQNETGGEEPVSGQTGAGTVNEPYDKGNEDANPTSTDPNITTMSSQSTGDPSSGQQPFQKQQGGDRPTDAPSNPAEHQAVDTTKNEAEAAQSGTAENTDTTQTSGNDTTQTSGNTDTTQTSGDTDTTSTGTEATKITSGDGKHPRDEDERQEMAQKGELPKIPGDHSGEPMKMHGAEGGGEAGEDKKDRSASVAQEGGGEHGKEQGTGEQWVKSTGTAAEGGDFDATKPGAGKEATRLLEQKGVHKDKPAEEAPSTGSADNKATAKEEKPSTVEKIKDKLHIGSGKHD